MANRTRDFEPECDEPGQAPAVRTVSAIAESFVRNFCPGSEVIYVRNGRDPRIWDRALLSIATRNSCDMPDVVLKVSEKNWLILAQIAAVRGPIDSERRDQLLRCFEQSGATLTFLTVFSDREEFSRLGESISWETDVWIADEPAHLIHFNGARFLGPYPHA